MKPKDRFVIKKATGIPFEYLVKQIHKKLLEQIPDAKLEHDIRFSGPDGPRQIDIMVTSSLGPYQVRTVIECKDYKRPVTIKTVDEFASKMCDVKANIGIIVSSNGFTQSAVAKAKRCNISLCTAHQASSKDWKIPLSLRIMLIVYSLQSYRFIIVPGMSSPKENGPQTKFSLETMLNINGIPAGHWLSETWNSRLAAFKINDDVCVYSHDCSDGNTWTLDKWGNRITLEKFEIIYKCTKIHMAGVIGDIDEAKALIDITNAKATIFVDQNKIIDSQHNLKRYDNPEDIPDGNYLVTWATHPLPDLTNAVVVANSNESTNVT